MKYFSLLFFCLAFLLGSSSVKASHIAALDISYEHLGNNEYEFTVRLYRDCSGINAFSSIFIDIDPIGACASSSMNLTANLVSQREIPLLCSDSAGQNSCSNPASNGIGYEEHIYKGRINLSQFQGCKWRASYESCCRNNAITTIINPAGASIYVFTSLLDSTIGHNSAPYFNSTPVFVVCDNSLQNVSNTMIDPDGDSLAYSLVPSLQSANQPVMYMASTSGTQPLLTTGGFPINPSSGQFMFTPAGQQVGIADILVQEYRNGQLIGESQRTLQIAVVPCNNNNAVALNQVSRWVNGTWQPQGTNTTFDVCPGESLTFKLDLLDIDLGDSILISEIYSSLLRTYPNAVIQATAGATANQLSVEITLPVAQIGSFTLGFSDDACPVVNLQTFGIDLVARANCAQFSGRLFIDDNSNCLADASENTPAGGQLYISKGNAILSVPVDGQGNFSMVIDTGTYNLSYVPTSSLNQLCPTLQSFTITASNPTVYLEVPVQVTAWCPLLQVNIGAAALVHCQQSTYVVGYCNNGNVTANNASVTVTLDSLFVVDSTTLPILSQSGNVYTFDLDSLPVGFCGSFQIVGVLDTACDFSIRGFNHCATAHIYPDILCNAWPGARLEIEGRCFNDSVAFRVHNVGQQAMSTVRPVRLIIDNTTFLTGDWVNLAAGASSPWVSYAATGQTYRAEIEQELYYPWGATTATVVEACLDSANFGGSVSTGMVNIFSLNEGLPYLATDCQPNVGSYDPNDKQAFPIGYSTAHYIKANEDLKYRIRFQNTGTFFAQDVVVIDTLSWDLNPTTIVSSVASHAYYWRLKEGRILEFYFNNIQLPAAQDDSLASQGFVDFKIKQKTDNPIGTVIHNTAAIYFDRNPPIITNTTFHTIGENFIVFTDLPKLEQGDAVTITAFPNPFDQATTLRVKGDRSYENLTLQVYNTLGQLVEQVQTSTNAQEIVLQRKRLQAGVYFYRLEGDGHFLHAGRLIAQ